MRELLTSKLHEEIVMLTAEYGYLSVEEVSMITGNLRHAYNVLQYLFTKRTLGTFSTHLRPSKAYYLPDDMKKIVEASGQAQHVERFYPYSYRPTGFHHHTSLIKVHLTIKKIFADKLIDYIPEPRLKRDLGKQKVCDGEFIFLNNKGEQKKVGIEAELTLKSAEARTIWVKNLLGYAENRLDVVLIFYNHDIIKCRIAETVKKFGRLSFPIYFISLEEFLNKRESTIAVALDGAKINIFKGGEDERGN
jgi:hypothetical protein